MTDYLHKKLVFHPHLTLPKQRRHCWSLNRPQETEYLLVSLTLEINAPKKLQILRKQGRSNLKTCVSYYLLSKILLIAYKQDIFELTK